MKTTHRLVSVGLVISLVTLLAAATAPTPAKNTPSRGHVRKVQQVGDGQVAYADPQDVAIAGDQARAEAKNDGIAIVGQYSKAMAGPAGVAIGAARSSSGAADYGVAIARVESRAEVGLYGAAVAIGIGHALAGGRGSVAHVGAGLAETVAGGIATAANVTGIAVCTGPGVAVATEDETYLWGVSGSVFVGMSGSAPSRRIITATVGEGGLLPETYYKYSQATFTVVEGAELETVRTKVSEIRQRTPPDGPERK